MKESREGYVRGFGRSRGKGEILYLYYNLKNRRQNNYSLKKQNRIEPDSGGAGL